MSKESDEKRKLLKKLWARCYMRLKKQLQRKPTKEEVEDCIAHEIYLLEHNLAEERRGRPRHEAGFLDTVSKRVQGKREIALEMERQLQKEVREDTAGVDLRFWKDDEDEPTHEEEMKQFEREINENLEEQCLGKCCRYCGSYPCRCPR